jgi:hypothetical protein
MPYPWITSTAQGTPFNNSTNGFTSTDVQAAIEEAKEGGFERNHVLSKCQGPGLIFTRKGGFVLYSGTCNLCE